MDAYGEESSTDMGMEHRAKVISLNFARAVSKSVGNRTMNEYGMSHNFSFSQLKQI